MSIKFYTLRDITHQYHCTFFKKLRLNLNVNVKIYCLVKPEKCKRILSWIKLVQTALLLRTVSNLTSISYVNYSISWLVKSSWELCWLQLQFSGWEKQRVRKSGSSTQSPAWAPGKTALFIIPGQSQSGSTINTDICRGLGCWNLKFYLKL